MYSSACAVVVFVVNSVGLGINLSKHKREREVRVARVIEPDFWPIQLAVAELVFVQNLDFSQISLHFDKNHVMNMIATVQNRQKPVCGSKDERTNEPINEM